MTSLHSTDRSTDLFHTLATRGRSLLVLQGVLECRPGRDALALIDALALDAPAGQVGAAYASLFRALAGTAPATGAASAAGGLREALARAAVEDENEVSRSAWRGHGTTPALTGALAADLDTLERIAGMADELEREVGERVPGGLPPLPGGAVDGKVPGAGTRGAARVDGDRPATEEPVGGDALAGAMIDRLVRSQGWGALAPALIEHYARHGSGPLAIRRAFRWQDGRLKPVRNPDVPSPRSLVGYTEERALLRQNTAQLVAGFAANSVLLYGDRGTGKSSSVKSLLHPDTWADDDAGVAGTAAKGLSAGGNAPAEAWQRLRLIELPKAHLADFPRVIAPLRGRPQKFIIFVDDLSFEDGETQYKDMKAMLEGGIEARPENVVVYATSNRRHLIREQFADRTANSSTEVHARDTVQEKLSFSDRFGITITFATPDQAAYLDIVESLARQRGLTMHPAALRARAIEWAAWHNGRSGRTARQLVDFLEGELGLAGAQQGGAET